MSLPRCCSAVISPADGEGRTWTFFAWAASASETEEKTVRGFTTRGDSRTPCAFFGEGTGAGGTPEGREETPAPESAVASSFALVSGACLSQGETEEAPGRLRDGSAPTGGDAGTAEADGDCREDAGQSFGSSPPFEASGACGENGDAHASAPPPSTAGSPCRGVEEAKKRDKEDGEAEDKEEEDEEAEDEATEDKEAEDKEAEDEEAEEEEAEEEEAEDDEQNEEEEGEEREAESLEDRQDDRGVSESGGGEVPEAWRFCGRSREEGARDADEQERDG